MSKFMHPSSSLPLGKHGCTACFILQLFLFGLLSITLISSEDSAPPPLRLPNVAANTPSKQQQIQLQRGLAQVQAEIQGGHHDHANFLRRKRHLQEEENAVTVSREETTNTTETPIPEGGERLVIEVNFIVSSTSASPTNHSVDSKQLENTLQIFTITLLQEWAYRMRRQQRTLSILHDTNSTVSVLLQNAPATNLRGRSNRRLRVTLVPDTVIVSPHLVASQDCITSVSDVLPQGQTRHCHKAHGRFQIDITADEDQEQVCQNMRRSIEALMGENYLEEALQLTYGDASSLDLQPGEMEACIVEREYVAPTTAAPQPTTAPTVAPLTVAPTPSGNIFEQSSPGPNPSPTTNAPTILATPTSATPTAPSPTPKPVNEWLATLEEYTGDGNKENDENGDNDEGTGTDWADLIAATTGQDDDEDASPTAAPAPTSSGGGGSRNYTAEMELLRQEFYDDSTLDLVIFIMLASFAGLLLLACCCFCADLGYISLYGELDEFFFEDEEGNLYHDENLQFPKEQFTKGQNNELIPLIEEPDEDDASAEEEEEDGEGSLFMSDSEDESSEFGDLDGDFAVDYGDEDDLAGESGDFYVDSFEEDKFDDDEEDVSEERSDFFDDEK